MGRGWESDKARADRFDPHIKLLLADTFIQPAPPENDQTENTDYWVYEVRPYRIACRIRRFKYYENPKYRNQVTFRTSRPSGAKTEFQKIIEGWGDYNLYGFSDQGDNFVYCATLIDLAKFRTAFTRHLYLVSKNKSGFLSWEERTNTDGSSDFWAFDLNSMPEDVIFRSWEYPDIPLLTISS